MFYYYCLSSSSFLRVRLRRRRFSSTARRGKSNLTNLFKIFLLYSCHHYIRFIRVIRVRFILSESKRIQNAEPISRCLGGYLSFARNRSRWLRRPLSRLGQSCKHVGSRCSIGSAIDASIIALAYSRFSVGECRGAYQAAVCWKKPSKHRSSSKCSQWMP